MFSARVTSGWKNQDDNGQDAELDVPVIPCPHLETRCGDERKLKHDSRTQKYRICVGLSLRVTATALQIVLFYNVNQRGNLIYCTATGFWNSVQEHLCSSSSVWLLIGDTVVVLSVRTAHSPKRPPVPFMWLKVLCFPFLTVTFPPSLWFHRAASRSKEKRGEVRNRESYWPASNGSVKINLLSDLLLIMFWTACVMWTQSDVSQ